MSTPPNVYAAWSAVMDEVQAISKRDRNEQQRYVFRGIDAVMNAVGPALRKHGVSVLPINVEPHWRDVQTSTGKASRECTVIVTYRVYGPAGDHFDGMAPGESMDFGDKGAPKAMSVAYRTFLLQALTIPTDEPEPDAASYERAPVQQHRQAPEPPVTHDPNVSARNAVKVRILAAVGGDKDEAKRQVDGLDDPTSIAQLHKLAETLEAKS